VVDWTGAGETIAGPVTVVSSTTVFPARETRRRCAIGRVSSVVVVVTVEGVAMVTTGGTGTGLVVVVTSDVTVRLAGAQADSATTPANITAEATPPKCDFNEIISFASRSFMESRG